MLALAAVQTACGLGALGVAFVNGSAVHPTSQVLLAAAFASACVLLRVISSDDRRSLFLVATFACAASAFTRAALTALPEPRPALVDLVFRGLVPEAFGPAALWQFAVDFPHVRRFTAFDRLARRAAAVAWLLGIVLFTVNLAGAYDAIDPWPAAVLRRDHPANLFWHLFVLAILPAVAAILLRSRRALPAERRQVARFAAAFAAGTAPLLVCGIARMAFPRFDQWFLMPGAHEDNFAPGRDRQLSHVQDRATFHDFAQGAAEPTKNPLDVAIDGGGFFVVQTPAGERYTRDGSFQINNQGQLVNASGYPVLGSGGPITFQQTDKQINIASDGNVTVIEGAGRVDSVRGKLRMVKFASPQALVKEGSNLYSGGAAQADTASRARQGYVEKSNVNSVLEMSRLIEVNRTYTQIASMLQQQHDLHRSAIDKLAEVPN